MANKKSSTITDDKNRVILSDVLPYETPVIFSNRYFYKFLVENKVYLSNDANLLAKSSKLGVTQVMNLLLNAKDIVPHTSITNTDKKEKRLNNALRNIPFTFKIAHKSSDYRALSIPHPLNQVNIIKFYDENKEFIQYFSSVSNFSIRHPYKIARSTFVNDYLHKLRSDEDGYLHKGIELSENETENIKSFFTYKYYSNIHEFFESQEYQASERKYNFLYKFDISKFFDSIYTHSIVWGLLNKEIVKDNLKPSKKTFAGKFDKLMQEMNYGETNGILIGPEVSRIFAEILLQTIDKNVLIQLSSKEIHHEKHYRLYRYVDDYFLFYDDESHKNLILDCFKRNLKEYGLYISDSKSVLYIKPIVTDLTIAKVKITDLLDCELGIEFSGDSWKAGFNSNKVITRFKIIVKESNIEYKDIINYSLAVIEKRVLKILSVFRSEQNKQEYLSSFIKYLLSVLELSFFIYSVAPRVSSTIKIVSLLSKVLQFIKLSPNGEIKDHQIESIYTKIYTNVCSILEKNKLHRYNQNENIYLLIVLSELGRAYRLSVDELSNYFIHCNNFAELNYFTITALLFYMKNIKRFDDIKDKLLVVISDKFASANKDNIKKDTEMTLLLMDLLTCPYIKDSFKRILLKDHCGIVNLAEQTSVIQFQKYWFTKWTNFNLAEEIEMKKGQEVYS